MAMIAVIDADVGERQAVRDLLTAMGVDVKTFTTAESFLADAPHALTCVVAELRLPDLSGLELLRRLRANGNGTPVVLLAHEADVRTAVEAIRLGAADFIEKSQLDVALARRVSQLLRNGAEQSKFVVR